MRVWELINWQIRININRQNSITNSKRSITLRRIWYLPVTLIDIHVAICAPHTQGIRVSWSRNCRCHQVQAWELNLTSWERNKTVSIRITTIGIILTFINGTASYWTVFNVCVQEKVIPCWKRLARVNLYRGRTRIINQFYRIYGKRIIQCCARVGKLRDLPSRECGSLYLIGALDTIRMDISFI